MHTAPMRRQRYNPDTLQYETVARYEKVEVRKLDHRYDHPDDRYYFIVDDGERWEDGTPKPLTFDMEGATVDLMHGGDLGRPRFAGFVEERHDYRGNGPGNATGKFLKEEWSVVCDEAQS